MSDEEVYFDDDNQEPEGDEPEEFHGEEEESLEQKYLDAKGSIGFEDSTAVDLFYDIYVHPKCPPKLQAKSLKRAAITCSKTDDYERTLACLSDVFGAHENGVIDDELCTKIITNMMANLSGKDEPLNNFLSLAAENVDKASQLQLYVDIKLRQSEIALKNADFNRAKDLLSEVEQFVGIPPDASNQTMCRLAVRILLLKIELEEEFNKDEETIFNYVDTLEKIPHSKLPDIPAATLEKIEGQKALRNHDYQKATVLFHDAFSLFDHVGSNKRIDCLPFLALAIMCNQDLNSMEFCDNQISPYIYHPIVAPLKQLLDQFKDSKYVMFNNLLDNGKKVFQQKIKDASPYIALLEDVRLFVLRNNIKYFCPSYKKLEFSFLSKELKCQTEEAKKLVFDLIINHEINALIDTDSNLIIMQSIPERSIYLENVRIMLESLAETVKKQTRKEKIRID